MDIYRRIQELETELFEQANLEANFRLELRMNPGRELRQILVSQLIATSKRVELAKKEIKQLECTRPANSAADVITIAPRRRDHIPVQPRPLVSMQFC